MSHWKKSAQSSSRKDKKQLIKLFRFGLPLDQLQCTYLPDFGNVPTFLVETGEIIRRHVDVEGLFRKSADLSRQDELKLQAEQGRGLGQLEVHEVTCLVKTFFRLLPEPLLPCLFHDPLLSSMDLPPPQRTEAVQGLCFALPALHLSCLRYFMNLLAEIALHVHMNRMNARNLAVVMTPSLIRLKVRSKLMSAEELRVLPKQTALIEHLISHAATIGCMPPQLYHHSMQMAETLLQKKLSPKKKKKSKLMRNMEQHLGAARAALGILANLHFRPNTSTTVSDTTLVDGPHARASFLPQSAGFSSELYVNRETRYVYRTPLSLFPGKKRHRDKHERRSRKRQRSRQCPAPLSKREYKAMQDPVVKSWSQAIPFVFNPGDNLLEADSSEDSGWSDEDSSLSDSEQEESVTADTAAHIGKDDLPVATNTDRSRNPRIYLISETCDMKMEGDKAFPSEKEHIHHPGKLSESKWKCIPKESIADSHSQSLKSVRNASQPHLNIRTETKIGAFSETSISYKETSSPTKDTNTVPAVSSPLICFQEESQGKQNQTNNGTNQQITILQFPHHTNNSDFQQKRDRSIDQKDFESEKSDKSHQKGKVLQTQQKDEELLVLSNVRRNKNECRRLKYSYNMNCLLVENVGKTDGKAMCKDVLLPSTQNTHEVDCKPLKEPSEGVPLPDKEDKSAFQTLERAVSLSPCEHLADKEDKSAFGTLERAVSLSPCEHLADKEDKSAFGTLERVASLSPCEHLADKEDKSGFGTLERVVSLSPCEHLADKEDKSGFQTLERAVSLSPCEHLADNEDKRGFGTLERAVSLSPCEHYDEEETEEWEHPSENVLVHQLFSSSAQLSTPLAGLIPPNEHVSTDLSSQPTEDLHSHLQELVCGNQFIEDEEESGNTDDSNDSIQKGVETQVLPFVGMDLEDRDSTSPSSPDQDQSEFESGSEEWTPVQCEGKPDQPGLPYSNSSVSMVSSSCQTEEFRSSLETTSDDTFAMFEPETTVDDTLALFEPKTTVDDTLVPFEPKTTVDDTLVPFEPKTTVDDTLALFEPKTTVDDTLALFEPESNSSGIIQQPMFSDSEENVSQQFGDHVKCEKSRASRLDKTFSKMHTSLSVHDSESRTNVSDFIPDQYSKHYKHIDNFDLPLDDRHDQKPKPELIDERLSYEVRRSQSRFHLQNSESTLVVQCESCDCYRINSVCEEEVADEISLPNQLCKPNQRQLKNRHRFAGMGENKECTPLELQPQRMHHCLHHRSENHMHPRSPLLHNVSLGFGLLQQPLNIHCYGTNQVSHHTLAEGRKNCSKEQFYGHLFHSVPAQVQNTSSFETSNFLHRQLNPTSYSQAVRHESLVGFVTKEKNIQRQNMKYKHGCNSRWTVHENSWNCENTNEKHQFRSMEMNLQTLPNQTTPPGLCINEHSKSELAFNTQHNKLSQRYFCHSNVAYHNIYPDQWNPQKCSLRQQETGRESFDLHFDRFQECQETNNSSESKQRNLEAEITHEEQDYNQREGSAGISSSSSSIPCDNMKLWNDSITGAEALGIYDCLQTRRYPGAESVIEYIKVLSENTTLWKEHPTCTDADTVKEEASTCTDADTVKEEASTCTDADTVKEEEEPCSNNGDTVPPLSTGVPSTSHSTSGSSETVTDSESTSESSLSSDVNDEYQSDFSGTNLTSHSDVQKQDEGAPTWSPLHPDVPTHNSPDQTRSKPQSPQPGHDDQQGLQHAPLESDPSHTTTTTAAGKLDKLDCSELDPHFSQSGEVFEQSLGENHLSVGGAEDETCAANTEDHSNESFTFESEEQTEMSENKNPLHKSEPTCAEANFDLEDSPAHTIYPQQLGDGQRGVPFDSTVVVRSKSPRKNRWKSPGTVKSLQSTDVIFIMQEAGEKEMLESVTEQLAQINRQETPQDNNHNDNAENTAAENSADKLDALYENSDRLCPKQPVVSPLLQTPTEVSDTAISLLDMYGPENISRCNTNSSNTASVS